MDHVTHGSSADCCVRVVGFWNPVIFEIPTRITSRCINDMTPEELFLLDKLNGSNYVNYVCTDYVRRNKYSNVDIEDRVMSYMDFIDEKIRRVKTGTNLENHCYKY